MTPLSAPDYVFLDTVLLACRLGHVRHEEQKAALLAAACTATDGLAFLAALERVGVAPHSDLYDFAGAVLASPSTFRAMYPGMLGLRRKGEPPRPFLRNPYVWSLVEPVLNSRQQQLFYETYWWFVRNHDLQYCDPLKGMLMGIYAAEPKDNASTVARFEAHLFRLVHHKTRRISKRFEGFPADIVAAVLRRAFCE